MAKKKMSLDFSYLRPPRLLKGWKWLIEWEEFIPGTSDKVRIRKTYDLNRAYFVSDPTRRQQRAQMILEEKLKEWNSLYRPTEPARLELADTNIIDAMQVALNFKNKTEREHTRITYGSFTNIFCEWLNEHGLAQMKISDFDRIKAIEFLDWVIMERKNRHGKPVGSRTYNNYIINLRSLFFVLVERKYLKQNPFSNHKKRKEEAKLRHPFEQQDSNTIAQYVYKHNRPVYLAILLISHCGMRLSELRRMRIRDIDLERGMVILNGNQTKNKDLAFITIPSTALNAIRDFDLSQFPASYFLFGQGLKPHPKLPCGRNTISDRFREMLETMVKEGILKSKEGYTAYSWKDTGAIAMVRAGLDILAIQKHLRHKSLATTQQYLQTLGIINRDIRDFKGVIFLLPTDIK